MTALAHIQKGRTLMPRRVMLYGVHGVGKSTFGAMAETSVFITTEEGTNDIDCDRFPLATKYADVLGALSALYSEEHGYRTVVIDSLDWLERLIWAEVCAKRGVETIEDIGYAKGYVFALTQWREVLAGLDALRTERGMQVVLIAHAAIEKFANPETDTYDRYVPRLQKQASALIQEWCDEVLFATYRVHTKTQSEGFDRKRTQGIGTGERIHRLPKVAQARGVAMREIAERIFVDNLRGRLQDIFTLAPYFESLEPGRYKVIVLDAFYRFMPAGGDENDNGTMANIYNRIDAFADRLGCCFVLIHHSTKGSQSGKSVTDVGAGAGAQSRATDTHLVLRPHEEDGVVVLDAAVRSWPPIDPTCLRWDFPVWSVDGTLDPGALKNERPGKKKEQVQKPAKPGEPSWDVERFVAEFISVEPASKAQIRESAKGEPGLSWRRVADLLDIAETRGLVHRWRVGSAHRVLFATVPQPVSGEGAGS